MSSDQHVPLLKKRVVTESETTGFSDEEKRIVLLPAGTEFIDFDDVVGAIKEYEKDLYELKDELEKEYSKKVMKTQEDRLELCFINGQINTLFFALEIFKTKFGNVEVFGK